VSDLRIGGLVSGLDIDQIVNDLISIERSRVDQYYQKKQLLEWQREDYREINTRLLAVRNEVFDLKLQGTFLAKSASSSDEDILEVTAGTSAVAGNYTVKVNSLASGVYKTSTAALGSSEDRTNLSSQFGLSGTVTFTLTGKDGTQVFSFDTATDSINTVVAEINAADIGIRASYDSSLDRFFLMTTETGSEATIQVDADPDSFLATTLKLDTSTEYGTDANIDLNDAAGLTFSSNQFTVNGINFNLKGESASSVTVSVTNNVEAVIEKIQDFVTAYNSTIEAINTELTETRYRDYPPLTDAQREEMTERQIELWEEKARSGLLKGDSLLTSIVQRIRNAVIRRVEGLSGDYDNLTEIGITTGQYYENGKLHLDVDQLREALTNDPEGVMELFTSSSDTEANQGIAYYLYDVIDNSMDLIQAKAGSSSAYYDNSYITNEIRRVDEQIDKMEERLEEIEDRYWRQFTALEQAIAAMNAQSAWLAQQFGQQTY